MQEKDIKALQARRGAKALERSQNSLREQHGESILRALAELLGADVSVKADSVHASVRVPELARKIEASPGLVAAYIGLSRARQLLMCCRSALGGGVHAQFWFEEKSYMGVFSKRDLQLPALADLAERLEDRIVVMPASTSGFLVIDY